MKPSPSRAVRTELGANFHKALGRAALAPTEHQTQPQLALALVEDASSNRVSDIHIEPQSHDTRVRFRIDGVVWDVAQTDRPTGQLIVNQLKALAGLDPIVRFTPRDAHARVPISSGAMDLRMALTPCQSGEAVSVRLLDPKRLERTIDDLGLNPENLRRLEQWLENVKGMFLASGPTGSGKTTTVYSLLHELKYSDRTIVSLEDPVEYQMDGVTQVQLDEKHHLSFAEGVKAMLRLDPDYLMVGEIRDALSAHSAINAALSGRVLLSTIHSRDAVGTLTAMRNWGLGDHEIAEALTVVVAQRLVRRLCPHCKRPGKPDSGEAAWLRSVKAGAARRVWRPVGCEKCNHLGYFGRIGVFEFWQLDGSDYDLILAHADEHVVRENLARREHGTLLASGMEKARDGVTSLAELRRIIGATFPGQVV